MQATSTERAQSRNETKRIVQRSERRRGSRKAWIEMETHSKETAARHGGHGGVGRAALVAGHDRRRSERCSREACSSSGDGGSSGGAGTCAGAATRTQSRQRHNKSLRVCGARDGGRRGFALRIPPFPCSADPRAPPPAMPRPPPFPRPQSSLRPPARPLPQISFVICLILLRL